jgi:GNAT superfamily N-acetyltransferase
MTTPIHIRQARREDAALILDLIRELAEYEKLAHEAKATQADLKRDLFGDKPCAEVLIGEIAGQPQGFALFFGNYSTFVGRPGIYLEDLYVRPDSRGAGLGKALLAHIAALAVQRGCGRLEWSVLDWNEPALKFYRALGAAPMSEWTVHRVSGDALSQLAAQTRSVAV